MASASPVEEAVRVTETKPLTKEDLVAYLASGCKPRSDWR
jgi:glutamate--cysteine ligase